MSTTASNEAPDVYGQVHPVETPELIAAKLDEFGAELDKLQLPNNTNVVEAQKRCAWINDTFKLLFLRAEVFHADLAAARYCAYWDKRVELFGPDRAFQPLTLATYCSPDDRAALESGFMSVVELDKSANDNNKRNYIFVDPSKYERGVCSRESMVRAAWYMIHSLLQDDETVQKKGAFFFSFPRHAKFSQFDNTMVKMMLGSIQGCLPIRLSAMHICHPPLFFQMIFPIVRMFLSKRLKKRVLVHGGSDKHVLERFETNFKLSKADLPTDLGGDKVLDVKAWLEKREKAGK